ncbi:MAG: metal-dependent transcriptional regulator [Streptococcaceae bacterium]|nr:metal-dependent transcriptional regulator [Streptococcaceae bacterium]
MLKLSKNEQDYLKAIYNLESKNDNEAVSIHLIAKKLDVASPSATEMIKRLSKKELVIYTPYRGVSLSHMGRVQARFIIKSHRVWETFLVEKLGYLSEEVHDEAENLEHASSPKLVEYLYALLGYPKTDPHGSEIPSEVFWEMQQSEIDLKQAKIGERYYITTMAESCKDFFRKLEMSMPHLIKIIERLQDGSVIIKEDNGKCSIIPHFLQDKIYLMQRNGFTTRFDDENE